MKTGKVFKDECVPGLYSKNQKPTVKLKENEKECVLCVCVSVCLSVCQSVSQSVSLYTNKNGKVEQHKPTMRVTV